MTSHLINRLLLLLLVCAVPALTSAVEQGVNDWPIVAVFAQPSTSKEGTCGGSCQYIAASYVKYLEAAGARVVPVNYYSTKEEIDALLTRVNGVFFTGGSSSFPTSAQHAYDRVKVLNDADTYLPLHGTCMGFQVSFLPNPPFALPPPQKPPT